MDAAVARVRGRLQGLLHGHELEGFARSRRATGEDTDTPRFSREIGHNPQRYWHLAQAPRRPESILLE